VEYTINHARMYSQSADVTKAQLPGFAFRRSLAMLAAIRRASFVLAKAHKRTALSQISR
jgi:hypothetical protein